MTAIVLRGDAMNLPIPDGSVDLVITSPPYFALRDYRDGGASLPGQVGSEPTPAAFVDALIAATREMVRVLKPSGSIFVNLGDKYCAGTSAGRPGLSKARTEGGLASGQGWHDSDVRLSEARAGVRTKSLLGTPWRYALRCIDDLGLILRAELIWSKPNGLPESVTDRVRRSHETWFHLVQQPRYYSAVDEIREQHGPSTTGRNPHGARGPLYKIGADGVATNGLGSHPTGVDGHLGFSPLGKLPGSVWTVPTAPLVVPDHLAVDHFAAFPPEWPKRLILGWSPPGVCTACGQGRRPATTAAPAPLLDFAMNQRAGRSWNGDGANPTRALGTPAADRNRTITGYVCACAGTAAPTTPSVILDPFSGTGTTVMVAHALGRTGIGVDLSADYTRLARWRTADLAQQAKVRDELFRKPEPVTDGQTSLFEGVL